MTLGSKMDEDKLRIIKLITEQLKTPTHKKITNTLVLIAECLWFNVKERSRFYRIVRCPVCGWLGCDGYYICQNCDWQNDNDHLYPDEKSGPNCISFNEYKQIYNNLKERMR